MIKAVALDLDGTLIDTEPYYFQLMARVLKQEVRYELTKEEYRKYFMGLTTLAGMENMTEVIYGARDKSKARELFKSFHKMAPQLAQNMSPNLFPGTTELLNWLYKRSIPFLIVTNTKRSDIELYPQWYKTAELLGDDLSKLVTFEDTGAPKPDPALYLEAARRLGVKPEEVLVVEDTDQGVEAGRRAGARVARVHTSGNGQEKYCFTDLKQLVKCLATILD